MKRVFTFLIFGLSLLALPVIAQDVDESYAFFDEDGEIIENGTTVVRNVVESYDEESEVIYSGISVMNLSGSSNDYLKMLYTIEKIDNGNYQICFPASCNTQDEAGSYETGMGQLMADLQDIQSEWFPIADGECIVHLTIEIFAKEGLFPPTYNHKAYGPSITIRFVKGDIPGPEPVVGDVNGDREVNIADVNAAIDLILRGFNDLNGDVNGDGEVNIADVNAIIDIILNQ